MTDDNLLLTEIESVLEAWQDEGKDYIVHHSFSSMAYEILAKVKQHYEEAPKFNNVLEADAHDWDTRGLDRPDREKMKQILRPNCCYLNKPNCPIENNSACECCEEEIDQILALIPDVEHLTKQFKLADKNYLELKNAFDERVEQAHGKGFEDALNLLIVADDNEISRKIKPKIEQAKREVADEWRQKCEDLVEARDMISRREERERIFSKLLSGNVISPMAQAKGEDYCLGLQAGWNLARATINQEILADKALKKGEEDGREKGET